MSEQCKSGGHDWRPVETPVDAGRQWYRCRECRIRGYAKGRFSVRGALPRGRALKVKPYRCSTEGCRRLAVRRLPGRGPRSCFLWACRECTPTPDL